MLSRARSMRFGLESRVVLMLLESEVDTVCLSHWSWSYEMVVPAEHIEYGIDCRCTLWLNELCVIANVQ